MKLIVNGQTTEVAVPPDTPLLWVLREELGLLGTKYGCGKALCGACTVHVDGAPRRSCVTAVGDVAGHPITTIEGLAEDGAMHPVQAAWLAENVPQCGYCQSGQIMSAVALLRAKPAPTGAEIDAVMSANLCRCGTYPRIRRAIERAAAAMGPGGSGSEGGAVDGGSRPGGGDRDPGGHGPGAGDAAGRAGEGGDS